jgi:hypothetical protein
MGVRIKTGDFSWKSTILIGITSPTGLNNLAQGNALGIRLVPDQA